MTSSAQPAIDLDALLERCFGNLELAERAIEMFLEGFPEEIAALETAIESRENQTASQLAHRMKGGARNIGAAGLASELETLEALAREGSETTMLDSIRNLRSEFNRLHEAVD